ncbi:MAG: cyclic nucleotide-binding domain-containing protein [Bacteroidota bacterium]
MKRVLFILGQLNDLDIEWMINNGHKEIIREGEKLIQQGDGIENIYIILEGNFLIIDEANSNYEIAKIGPGEIVGEMSFIDSRPPSASVVATKTSKVYAIDYHRMQRKLDRDPDFASRFYYSITLFLSERLRKTIGRLGYGLPEDDLDEIDTKVLNKVAQAGARFSMILNKFSEV